MGYRSYIAKKSKDSDLKKKTMIPMAIERSINDDGDFEPYTFVYNMGFKDVMLLFDDNIASILIEEAKLYIPQYIIDIYGDDFLLQKYSQNRIVELTKQDILTYILMIHNEMIEYYKNVNSDAVHKEMYLAGAKAKLAKWETSEGFCQEFGGKLNLPYAAENSREYMLIQLTDIYNNTDWENETIIMYGY